MELLDFIEEALHQVAVFVENGAEEEVVLPVPSGRDVGPSQPKNGSENSTSNRGHLGEAGQQVIINGRCGTPLAYAGRFAFRSHAYERILSLRTE